MHTIKQEKWYPKQMHRDKQPHIPMIKQGVSPLSPMPWDISTNKNMMQEEI